ncbi:MAG: FecR domain-containing protein [Planctomycetota bacterium]|jgi:ferric-dicitrate binding protein FerR (iron transport regulator)
MSDREDGGIPDDADLERALRDLPGAEADEGFRERLREAFVSGAFERAADEGQEPTRRAPSRILLHSVAAAAVLAGVIVAVVLGNRGPGIRVFQVSGKGSVTVDGVEIPVADLDRLQASLTPGAEVSVPPSVTLDVVVPGTVLFELTGGTRMTLPTAFGRWFPREVSGRLSAGEVRIVSGPRFAGRGMRLTTPEGAVAVSGTLLSVQCDDQGTCVCVLEGTVRVGVDEADMELIPPGKRKVMLRSGKVEILPVAPPHESGVLRFVERAADRFPRE